MRIFFIVLSFSLLLVACGTTKNLEAGTKPGQGISGIVTQKSGNQMPSPDMPENEGSAVKTTIYIYEATNISQVQRKGSEPFYDAIGTKLIATVDSDKNGQFSIELPTGTYSLFTKVNGKFYANSFDQFNNIATAMVEENKMTVISITISASASY